MSVPPLTSRRDLLPPLGNDVQRLPCPGRAARLVARLRRTALDGALARGANPAGSPLLAARAASLTAAASRDALADTLDLVIARAHGRPRRGRVTPPRGSVLENAATRAELARLVRGGTPLYARGLAMLASLLTDGSGPLYARGDGAALAGALGDARAALAG
jgi:hypothetical protein